MPAYLIWRLNMTYRYDNRREGIVGKNPAMESHASLGARLLGPVRRLAERPGTDGHRLRRPGRRPRITSM